MDTALTNTAGLVSAITSNNIQGGEAAAGVIAKALKDHGQVAVFSIDGTTATQVERVQGLKKGLAPYPGISIVSSQFTGQPETVSETDTKAIMTSHPQVKALFGAAETNAEGAAQALSCLGATGKLAVVAGYDADPSAVSLLKTGAISALVIQQPAREGQLGVEYGNDALARATPPWSRPRCCCRTSWSPRPSRQSIRRQVLLPGRRPDTALCPAWPGPPGPGRARAHPRPRNPAR